MLHPMDWKQKYLIERKFTLLKLMQKKHNNNIRKEDVNNNGFIFINDLFADTQANAFNFIRSCSFPV